MAMTRRLAGAEGREIAPDFIRIDAAARRLGFPTAAALRKWCEREGLAVRVIGRLTFVDMNEITHKIEVAPVKPPRKPVTREDVENEVERMMGHRRGA